MKKIFIILFCMALVLPAFANTQKKNKKKSKDKIEEIQQVELANFTDSIGYALGVWLSQTLSMGVGEMKDIDMNILSQAFSAALAGNGLMTNEEADLYLNSVYSKFLEEEEANKKKEGEKNKVESDRFMSEKAKEKGVIATGSGLLYEVLQEGDKEAYPNLNSTVTVLYEMSLLNGDYKESYYDEDSQITFDIDQLIAGWREGIQLMSRGAEYILYIPYDMAYGEAGHYASIMPYETFIFKIKLLDFWNVELTEAEEYYYDEDYDYDEVEYDEGDDNGYWEYREDMDGEGSWFFVEYEDGEPEAVEIQDVESEY